VNATAERLLELVAKIPAASRAEFLEGQCADSQVRVEVESLLPFYTDSEPWFEHSVHEIARSVRRVPELSPGDIAGAYRILSLIGIGGMGAVYLAERVDGAFQQEVAIKVVPSANAAFLLERFERERRIVALLNHPNIARILDGGEGPNGLPYFAMEYVAGETIDVFCEQRALPLRERLRLFLKVCDAVSHAHGRLVVHRDLKPANVLVTAGGEPKLLDFGIAKVLDPSHAATASTGRLTPDYASPEQVRGEAVTVASDIYSLGALLYKVLTGCAPHRLESKSPLEAAHIISECAAPPASSVSSGVPSDVSAILQKALHNDPTHRYAGVADLFLRYPTLPGATARPGGAGYLSLPQPAFLEAQRVGQRDRCRRHNFPAGGFRCRLVPGAPRTAALRPGAPVGPRVPLRFRSVDSRRRPNSGSPQTDRLDGSAVPAPTAGRS
jgi:hypothetical protein